MSRWQPPRREPPPRDPASDPGSVPRPPTAPLPPAVPVSPVRRVRGPSAAPPRRSPPPPPNAGPQPDDHGGWDPPPRDGFFRLIDEEQRFRQRVSTWMGVAGLALVTALLLLAWSGVQLTERANATRVLQEAITPLSDIDRLLERDYQSLVAQANAGAGSTVILESYPLGVAIPSAQLATMSALDVRAHVLAESAARIYESGLASFEREDGGHGSFFSPRGIFTLTAGQLSSRNHTIAIIVAVVLVLFFVPMLVLVLSNGTGPQRARNLGAGILLGGAGLTLGVVIGRALLRGLAGSDDVFSDALLTVGADVAWLPARNGLIFAGLGAIVLAGALGFTTWRAQVQAQRLAQEQAQRTPEDAF